MQTVYAEMYKISNVPLTSELTTPLYDTSHYIKAKGIEVYGTFSPDPIWPTADCGGFRLPSFYPLAYHFDSAENR